MDNKALYDLSYGLYLVTAKCGDKRNGCVINTAQQVTGTPPQMTVTLSKNNYTCSMLKDSDRLAVSVMEQNVSNGIITAFGFKSGADTDKFDGVQSEDYHGLPIIKQGMLSVYLLRVEKRVDLGTHIMFVCGVTDAEKFSDGKPLTYADYRQLKKGVTPPNAPSYIADGKHGFVCGVCGYKSDMQTLPEKFVCPVCGQPRGVFKAV